MLACLVVLALAAVDQSEPAATEARPLYRIYLKDGGKVYGYVDDDEWGKPRVKVELDTPWNARKVDYIPRNDIQDYDIEPTAVREKRLQDQAAEAKVEQINGQWVSLDEVQWADKAREAAGVGEDNPETATVPEAETGVESSASAPDARGTEAGESPGLVAQWGVQVVVVAVALVLVGAIVKTLVLRGDR